MTVDTELGPDHEPQGLRPIKAAYISVDDKRGLGELAEVLSRFEVEVYSQGGTLDELRLSGTAIDISETQRVVSERLARRLKGSQPAVTLGIELDPDDVLDRSTLRRYQVPSYDLVVVNPHKVVRLADTTDHAAVGAAIHGGKKDLAVICSPDQYRSFIEHLDEHAGRTTAVYRERLANEAKSRFGGYYTRAGAAGSGFFD